ncbi:hypothetical protein F511_38137 [Dorcoceras hygrometricum]|uniref:Uncharacterized protein n=1 Tax=Dorcoceras hygrometricum TaxID=472368 RepID=A0A2Z7BXL5_9LAMI|nr:hypothetical protein F511_38137 [Dorcoceras hygrometricum]
MEIFVILGLEVSAGGSFDDVMLCVGIVLATAALTWISAGERYRISKRCRFEQPVDSLYYLLITDMSTYVDVSITVERCVDDVDFTVREEDTTSFVLDATPRFDVAAGISRRKCFTLFCVLLLDDQQLVFRIAVILEIFVILGLEVSAGGSFDDVILCVGIVVTDVSFAAGSLARCVLCFGSWRQQRLRGFHLKELTKLETWWDHELKKQCYMLAYMSNELQRRFEETGYADDIHLHLKGLYGENSRTKRFSTVKELITGSMREGTSVREHGVHMIGLIEKLVGVRPRAHNRVKSHKHKRKLQKSG